MIIVGEYCGFYSIPISDLDTHLSFSVIYEEVKWEKTGKVGPQSWFNIFGILINLYLRTFFFDHTNSQEW